MRLALAEALAAQAAGEVPVGAVVVHRGLVIATGRNAPITTHDPTAHAEIVAIRSAAQQMGNYRLDECELFVTLEPCTMCAGAMLHARLQRVVFGAYDLKTGAAGSVANVFANPHINHHTQVSGGVLVEDCANLLRSFFTQQRAKQRLADKLEGRALREDALRTPEARFLAWSSQKAKVSNYLTDLPSLAGLRLHYVDEGPVDASEIFLCLHDAHSWSYAWQTVAQQLSAQGKRVICPDLIGFGRSDKLKKESAHTLAWHAKVLLELIDRLDLRNITLIVSDNQAMRFPERFTRLLLDDAPSRIDGIRSFSPDSMRPDALAAPFPDAGHQAGLRAFAAFRNEKPLKIQL